MPGRRSADKSFALFRFDSPYLKQYELVAGVDEVGRGPLAGPVVSAAVILPAGCRIPYLADSKLLSEDQRFEAYRWIQRYARAIGVGIVPAEIIDQVNIHQASFLSMRFALGQLVMQPVHVLVDGFIIPHGPVSQTAIVEGDRKSACIAAASIVAKVTRDCMMAAWDRVYPDYGFRSHKGYGTQQHKRALRRHGPCVLHRRSFQPVEDSLC